MAIKKTKDDGAEQPAMVYVVVNPIEYGDERHETGAEVSGIPASSLPWLLEQGHIKLKESQ